MNNQIYSEITPDILALSKQSEQVSYIDPELYIKYDVKRGLRDLDGKGVVAGLTEISNVSAKKVVDGVEVPCEGHLYYRGQDINTLVSGFASEGRYGFEEIACFCSGSSPKKRNWIIFLLFYLITAPSFPPILSGTSS